VSAWLPIIVVAVVQLLSQLICAAGAIWQEQAHAVSRSIQMQTAASSGTLLYERLEDGSVLLIVPKPADPEQAATTAWTLSGSRVEHPLP
jgi:hypothetical protein